MAAMMGAAYKKDVDDYRESPSIALIEKLQAKGAVVNYNDPYIPKFGKLRHHDIKLESRELTENLLASQDAVLISTAHSAYDYDWIVEYSQLVLDTRNATKGVTKGCAKIYKA